VENGSLSNSLKPTRFGAFPESLVAVYTAQVLEGLAYLHEQGVIHRDIKGANILTTKEGLVKLADFGVATRLGAEVYKEQSVVGSPYWMAPEVIEMAGVSPASDIWSVGCTVVELLTGQPPYFELNPMTALFRIVQDDCPPIPDGISEGLQHLLRQCFAKAPRARPSAQALLSHPWILAHKLSRESSAGRLSAEGSGGTPSAAPPRAAWARARAGGGARVRLAPLDASAPDHESSESSSAALSAVPSAPPSPDLSWQTGRSGPPSSLTPGSSRRGAAGALAGWASGSAGSLTLTGEPSASRCLQLDRELSRSSALLELSAERPGPPSAPSPHHGGGGWSEPAPRSERGGGSDVGPPAAAFSARTQPELWALLARAEAEPARPASAAGTRGSSGWAPQPRLSAAVAASLHGGSLPPDFRSAAGGEAEPPEAASAELEAEASRQIGLLQPGRREGVLTAACERLEGLLQDAPAAIAPLLAADAAFPLMQLLDAPGPAGAVHAAALRLLAAAVAGRPRLADHLCALGLLQPVLPLCAPPAPPPVRQAAAALLRAALAFGGPPVRALTACRGLPALAALLEPAECGPMATAALECAWRVLEAQAAGAVATQALTAQCALAGLPEKLPPLLLALAAAAARARREAGARAAAAAGAAGVAASASQRWAAQPRPGSVPRPASAPQPRLSNDSGVSGAEPHAAAAAAAASAAAAAAEVAHDAGAERDGDSPACQLASACELLLAFARCPHPLVVSGLATERGIPPLLQLLAPPAPAGAPLRLQLRLLRALRALSGQAAAVEPLQRAGAIPVLVPFAAAAGAEAAASPAARAAAGPASVRAGGAEEAALEALHTLLLLCRGDAQRSEQAATAGLAPHCVRLARGGGLLEQPCLALLLAVAQSSRRGRAELGKTDALRIFIALLRRPEWGLEAAEALAAWLAAEAWRCEPPLAEEGDDPPRALVALLASHAAAPPDRLLRLCDALARLAGGSGKLGARLAAAGLVPPVLDAAGHADPAVRLGALQLLRALYEQHPRPKELIARFDLCAKLSAITGGGPDPDAVLVRAAAAALLDAMRVNDIM